MTTPVPSLGDRLFSDAVGAFDLAGVYLGDRLGLYASLAADGPARPDELAARTGTDERYIREWLEQQATAGILDAEPSGRFVLSDEHAAVLADPEGADFMAPLSRMLVGAFGRLPDLVDAYRTGAGVGWERYGVDMREGQADFNRPAFTHLLGKEWLPAIADVHERLSGEPAARVLDVGCGEGWSTIAIAKAYPGVRVQGIDLDGPSIEAAREHAAASGVADRVEFSHADAATLDGEGFDAAIIIEAVHDMANPVSVLRAIRGALRPGAPLVVVDERVAASFSPPGDEVERFMYGWSITTCLPDGRSRTPSVATGTVMRADTLHGYADEAGFTRFAVLPVENDFFRFYRLGS